MRKTSKKLIGGLLVGAIIATFGAVFATAQDEGTNDDLQANENFFCRPYFKEPGFFNENLTKNKLFFYDLTEDQQSEIEELIKTLKDQGANFSEIQTAIHDKLDEFGVLDQRLENEINQTEQRLQMLNRQKELREQGYTWEEIRNIIEEEFGVEFSMEFNNHHMRNRNIFGHHPCEGHNGFLSGE